MNCPRAKASPRLGAAVCESYRASRCQGPRGAGPRATTAPAEHSAALAGETVGGTGQRGIEQRHLAATLLHKRVIKPDGWRSAARVGIYQRPIFVEARSTKTARAVEHLQVFVGVVSGGLQTLKWHRCLRFAKSCLPKAAWRPPLTLASPSLLGGFAGLTGDAEHRCRL